MSILRHFLKIKKFTPVNIRISRLKNWLGNLYKKENFKPEIKSTIENLQDEFYKLENRQTNGAKTDGSLRAKNVLKLIFKVLERQNMQNQTISELYINDNKSKHSSNRTDIFKSARNFYEKLKTKKTTSKATTTEFLSKILIRNKTSNEQFHHCEAKLSAR